MLTPAITGTLVLVDRDAFEVRVGGDYASPLIQGNPIERASLRSAMVQASRAAPSKPLLDAIGTVRVVSPAALLLRDSVLGERGGTG
jgi:hypothetical protein